MPTPPEDPTEPSLTDDAADERLAVSDAADGDHTRLVELLNSRGLRLVADLLVGHRLIRRKRRGRPPIPDGSPFAHALADAIERKRHLVRYPIDRPMSVADYVGERWGWDPTGFSGEVVLFPRDAPSTWSAIITTAVGPAAVDARTIDGGGSHQARAIIAGRADERRPAGIAADRPAESSARL